MTESSTGSPAQVRIGIHTSIAGRLEVAALRAAELGCDACQILSTNPRRRYAHPLNEVEKLDLGRRVDRHQHIGKGKIDLETFRRLLHHTVLAGKAFTPETPIERKGDDQRNLRTLRRLAERGAARTVPSRGSTAHVSDE